MKKFVALFCVLALMALSAQKPNVVLIFADDLGYGDLGCYGATKLRTPNIDKLAAEGRRFTDGHSASAVCTPSRYALLTGEYPHRINLSRPVFLKTGLIVRPEKQTVADVMKDAGYATACIGKWHLGFGVKTPDWNGELKPGPLELGFDYYFGVPTVNSHPPFVYVENHRVVGLLPDDPFVYGKTAKTKAIHEKMRLSDIGGADAAHALYDDYAVGTKLAEKAVNWIKKQDKSPFFLYLATTQIHHSFTPAPRFQGTSECGPYGDFVHELDWMVGEVVKTLKEQGVADNTLIIFTSDNGGMFNETGQDAWDAGHRLNGELLGFKFGAWEGGHRVPFIAKWPGKIEAGSVSKQLICNIDMLATMAALTGSEVEEGQARDSVNVLPALTGNPQEPIRDHLVLAPNKAPNLAVRKGKWMYIGGKGGGGFTGRSRGSHAFAGPAAITYAGYTNSDIANGKIKADAPPAQLYDLENDLKQTTNLHSKYPEVVKEMSALLASYRPTTPAAPKRTPKPRERKKPTPQRKAPTPTANKPNIVFVMIDDLGAEAVGCYGGESYKTPHMDALAKQGMQFNHAFAAPMCMVSRATLLSGRYGFRSGLPRNIDRVARTAGGWGKDEITVANLLQDVGYTTAMSGKWHLAQIDSYPNHLADKGFEYQNVWAWLKGGTRTRRYWEATSYRDTTWTQDPPGIYGPDKYCEYIIDFMAKQKDSGKPFFAYYPMVLVHSPWPQTPDNINDPQPGWTAKDNLRIPETQKWSRQNFSAMIEYSDSLIGRVAKAIEDQGLAENTLLIVTADNGTYRNAISSYRGMKIPGGKGKVTDAGSRVPFFAVWKGRIVPGSVNDSLIDFSDILPTLVELSGGALPTDRRLDGQSFLGQMLGKRNAPERDWVFAGNHPKAAIRGHDYLLGADDKMYDIRENPYQPKPLTQSAFNPEQEAQYKKLKTAMDALGHNYTQGPGSAPKARKISKGAKK